jgi:hypothetical protein
MKPCLPDQIIVALAAIAGLCVLVFLGLSLSPAFAATLSRDANFSGTLSALRSLIYPFCANKAGCRSFRGISARAAGSNRFPAFDQWKEIA